MSMVRLQLLVGWPVVRYQIGDFLETSSSAVEIERRIKDMIDVFYPADASMESNLGNRQVIVRLDDEGYNLHYYEQIWKRIMSAAKGRAVA
jgi:hypothetical protein